MSWPPMIMRLRIKNKKQNLNLWLPIFLAYPIILAIALLLLPLVLIIVLVTWPSGWGRPFLFSGFYLARVIWTMRGLEIDIRKNSEEFKFYFK